MEVKIYEVRLQIECEQTDMDCCSSWEWETRFEDAFPTKRAAVRVCQSIFDKQPINDYVRSVHAAVYEVVLTDEGRTTGIRIYNKYKSTEL